MSLRHYANCVIDVSSGIENEAKHGLMMHRRLGIIIDACRSVDDYQHVPVGSLMGAGVQGCVGVLGEFCLWRYT